MQDQKMREVPDYNKYVTVYASKQYQYTNNIVWYDCK